MRITPQRTELRELPAGKRTGAPASPMPAEVKQGSAESARITPAMNALSAMAEVDMDKVAAIRQALSRGEIGFDADKLAGLIARYHGNQG
ncbi:flagellar biosynthesis anti-sigma factor FlgM [Aquitalea sp. S1-19]|nr:flagellar biosynthesis anti-sigma factor FlgM [Aquitalea sp. S1-19]